MALKFSEKSMKKFSEPDKLDTYIHVATPGAWMVLGSVALVLVALIIWGLLGEVNGVSVLDALFR